MIIIPCFFFRKRYRSIFFFYLVVAGLLLLSNIWYYRHFETAIPYTAFLMPENLDGLGPSILASMRIQDVSVVLPLISFVTFYYFTYASDKRDLPLCGRFGWVAVCRAIACPVGNFLAALRYTDRQIGRFIDHLKETGLYDKSIVVITGDHEHITCNLIKGTGKTLLSDRFVPLIILNALYRPVTEDAVIGQSDIYPTILI